jgi:hypothetical protein
MRLISFVLAAYLSRQYNVIAGLYKTHWRGTELDNSIEQSLPAELRVNVNFFLLFSCISVDWEALTSYPCYLSSLSNTKLVAQCTAQVSVTSSGLPVKLIALHVCSSFTRT